MLNKLALRNAKRTMKDYLVYLITMTAVSAMMFAFNSMIFSKDVQNMCTEAMVMGAMIGMITFFIILIVAWLINYMAKFMLEKRSKEFATYLLIGLKKKEISRIYMKENVLLGTAAFVLGTIEGIFLQQVLMTVFYSVFSEDYHLHMELNGWCMLMTAGCYFGCYLLALMRNKRIFKKMSIAELMRMEKENDQLKSGREKVRQWLFFVAVAYILFVYGMMVHGCSIETALLLMAGFVAAVYMLFAGISAFIICRVQKKKEGIYRGNRLFLFRQMSSKVRIMRFTTGTLTLLMVCALLGGSFSLMFSKFQGQAVDNAMPFDLQMYSPFTDDDFAEEQEVLEKYGGVSDSLVYRIYENKSQEMNKFFAAHLSTVQAAEVDGSGNYIQDAEYREYYTFDTYMRLSDYNRLRTMLGWEEVSLGKDQYAIQTKSRMEKEFGDSIKEVTLTVAGRELTQGAVYYQDGFSQSGINGADYLIIVPDELCEGMTPYYSDFAANLMEEATPELAEELRTVYYDKHDLLTDEVYDRAVEAKDAAEFAAEEMELSDEKITAAGNEAAAQVLKEAGYEELAEQTAEGETLEEPEELTGGTGTDQMIVVTGDLLLRDVDGTDLIYIVTAVTFPLAYISLIFVCVALTIMAVQQLSDSGKYRFRYDLLRKLGMKRREVEKLVLKQLSMFYLLPAAVAAAVSSVIAVYAGNQFVRYTGAVGNGIYYFGISLVLFAGVYMLYFAATYIGFKRNINIGR